MSSRAMRSAAALAAVTAALGCSSNDRFAPPPPTPACSANCTGAGPTLGGSSGSAGAGGGDAGAEQAIDVTGKVEVAVTAELDAFEGYAGAATVYAPGLMGTTVQAPFGGAGGGTTFTLKGALVGTDWLFVEDNTGGGTGVTSTFSPQAIPPASTLIAPVLDQMVLQSIAQSQPGAPLLDGARAQIILALRQGGKPLPGVSLESGAGAGLVTYDQGPGVYSSVLKATGSAGGIVILNAQAPAGGGGLILHLRDAGAHATTLQVPVAPGAATIGVFAL